MQAVFLAPYLHFFSESSLRTMAHDRVPKSHILHGVVEGLLSYTSARGLGQGFCVHGGVLLAWWTAGGL